MFEIFVNVNEHLKSLLFLMLDLLRSELCNIKSAIFAHIISAYPSGAHKLQVMNFFWKYKKYILVI